MSPIHVIAIDDELPALRRLVSMVENHPDLILAATARNSVEAKEKILQLKPDLLLLDIELKDATAFDLLTAVKDSFKGNIIFCTAFDKYALKAFDFYAVDYLLKPYTQERFNAAIERIIEKEAKTDVTRLIELIKNAAPDHVLSIPEGNKNYFLDSEKLYYITADTYYSDFVLKEEKKTIRISLKKLETLLPPHFIRINKSTIINKKFIIELIARKTTPRIVMADKNEFYVSDKCIDQIKNLL